jgi:hypothetical protein
MAAGTVPREQIPSMMATLCSYENCFGPYHPQTLGLMTQVAAACWQHGDRAIARRLLERAIADLQRDCEARVRAIGMLRDLLLEQGDLAKAAGVQRELLESQIVRLGEDHGDVKAARARLATILFASAGPD